MITIGVDLSAEDAKTCLARIEWRTQTATVTDLHERVSNSIIVEAASKGGKLGIDCPFGWPVPFIDYVTGHQQGRLVVPTGLPIEWRRQLANRMTDLHVRKKTGLIPLSVSADRIGHAAMRCAALLAHLVAEGIKVDRTGRTGRVVEVYPAASLHRWGMPHQGYKRRANLATLSSMVDTLLASATWLRLGAFEDTCRSNDDAFDAVIAALSARAWARGQTSKPSPKQASFAASEGWIALPKSGSLDRLTEVK